MLVWPIRLAHIFNGYELGVYVLKWRSHHFSHVHTLIETQRRKMNHILIISLKSDTCKTGSFSVITTIPKGRFQVLQDHVSIVQYLVVVIWSNVLWETSSYNFGGGKKYNTGSLQVDHNMCHSPLRRTGHWLLGRQSPIWKFIRIISVGGTVVYVGINK